MKKEEIIQRLMSNHHDFVDIVLSLDESEYCLSVNNKWTAGQHLKHIYLSVSPLVKAMQLPVFLLKWIFGKANRSSENYESLVEKYQCKLKLGAVASSRYIPNQL